MNLLVFEIAQLHRQELLREREHDALIAQSRAGVAASDSWQVRLAGALRTLAERLEASVARSETIHLPYA